LLWAGTELGLYASHDDGRSWRRTHLASFPTVPVHDILIHPRENDLILGTHGRGLFVFDDATPLQQFDPAAPLRVELFDVRPALRFPSRFTRYGLGDKSFRAPNPPSGALITYELPEKMGVEEKQPERVTLEILDSGGKVIRTVKKLGLDKGLNRVAWDLRTDPPFARKDAEDGGGDEEAEFGPRASGVNVLPGTYTARLTVDGKSHEKPVVVRIDPTVATRPGAIEAQYETAKAILDLRSQVNRTLRGLDATKAQLDERRRLAKQLGRGPDGDLLAQLDRVDARLKDVMGALAKPEGQGSYAAAGRISEQLGALSGGVDGAFAAPTAPQLAYWRELTEEARKALAAADAFQADGLAAVNEALAKSELPAVVALKPKP
jgi:hypothetical protein